MADSPFQLGEPLAAFPSCRGCLEDLAANAADLAGGDDGALRERVRRAGLAALEHGLATGLNSPQVANRILWAVRRESGAADPYRPFKEQELASARRAFDLARPHVGDDLRSLVGLAALGNSLDFFRKPEDAMQGAAAAARGGVELHHDDTPRLEAALAAGPELVLYLTDNTGEIYFDQPLFEHVAGRCRRAVLVVKGGPALNDLNRDGLAAAGLAERFAEVADTGVEGAGVEWDLAPESFGRLVAAADLIIAKGMANFETICPHPTPCPVFCVFRAKCIPMQDYLHAPPMSFWALWREPGAACRAPEPGPIPQGGA